MQAINYFKAGIFIVVSLTLFILSIYIMGSEREIFSSQKTYFSIFKDVKGLSEGAPIRLGGITIGRVGDINFAGTGSDREIEVKMAINEKYLPKIKLDSKVSIETQGLLGDKFLSLSVGQDERLAPPGSVIHPSNEGDVTEIMTKAAKIVDNSVQISEDVKILTTSLKAETIKEFSEAVKELSTLTKTLNSIASEIKNGKGLMHAMVYDEKGEGAVSSVSEIFDNLKVLSKTSSPNQSQEGIGDLMTKLNQTADNLKVASDSLKNGTGTIGALMVDSKVYDNLVEITDGAKRSYLLRQAVKSTLKK